MKVHPWAAKPPPLALLIVLSARSSSLFDAAILFGVFVRGRSVVYDMDTKSTDEAKAALNKASPASSFMTKSMLARVFVAKGMLL